MKPTKKFSHERVPPLIQSRSPVLQAKKASSTPEHFNLNETASTTKIVPRKLKSVWGKPQVRDVTTPPTTQPRMLIAAQSQSPQLLPGARKSASAKRMPISQLPSTEKGAEDKTARRVPVQGAEQKQFSWMIEHNRHGLSPIHAQESPTSTAVSLSPQKARHTEQQVLTEIRSIRTHHQHVTILPLSSKMTGDVGHIVTQALNDSSTHVLLLGPSRSSHPEMGDFMRIKQEVEFYLKADSSNPKHNRVSSVYVNNPHGEYRTLVSDKTQNIPKAGNSTVAIAKIRDTAAPFKAALNPHLLLHNELLGRFLYDTMKIDPRPSVKVFIWGRSSGRHTGTHPESVCLPACLSLRVHPST